MSKGRPRKPDKREANGQLQRGDTRSAQEEARRTALTARARHAGLLAPLPGERISKDRAITLKQPWMGTPAGLAIKDQPDVGELWETIQTIRMRRAMRLKAIEAPRENAKIADLGAESGVSDDLAPHRRTDVRTPEERAWRAERDWNAIRNIVKPIDQTALQLIISTCCLDERIVPGFDLLWWLRRIQEGLK